MSWDFNVLCVGQKQPSIFEEISSLKIINELGTSLRYHEIWGIMTRTEGIWYSIGRDEEGWFTALNLLEPDFDHNFRTFPYWITEQDIQSNLVPLLMNSEIKNDIQLVLDKLVQESPKGMVYLLIRMQGGDDEIVCGVLDMDEFWKLHDDKKILVNVCYIIKK